MWSKPKRGVRNTGASALPPTGVITRLEPRAHDRERVNVWIEGAFAFACQAELAVGLAVGDSLDEEAIQRIQAADTRERAFERAVRFLGVRPRSEAEVRARLTEAGFPDDVVALTLDRLRGLGYLDDEAFARYWVEQRQQFRPRGGRALAQELRLKRVEADVIASAIEEGVDETEAAYRAAVKQVGRIREDDPRRFAQRLGAYLQRRGFDYDAARAAVQRCWQERMSGESTADSSDDPDDADEQLDES